MSSVVSRPTVPREQVLQFIRGLGFEPNEVADVQLTPSTITVTEYHQHPVHGGRYCVEGTDGVVTVQHTLYLDDYKEGDA